MKSTVEATQAAKANTSSVPPDQRVRTRTNRGPRWWLQFTDPLNGKKGWSKGIFYQKPHRSDSDHGFRTHQDPQPVTLDKSTEYFHRDYFGRVTFRPQDVIRYISPTDGTPTRLIVQATPSAIANTSAGDWRRTNLTGQVPFVFKVSEWALSPSDKDSDGRRHFVGILDSICRIVAAAPVLLFMLSLPIDEAWTNADFQDNYKEFPNYFWDYPKFARNEMDMSPFSSSKGFQALRDEDAKDLSYKARLVRPRQLMVLAADKWVLEANPHQYMPYIFISWTGKQFKPWTSEQDRARIEEIAQAQALQAGVRSYWFDVRCMAPENEKQLRNADVYRMCDVIRGARMVCVVLSDLTSDSKREWGSRMWTLPEAMLSQSKNIKFCSPRREETSSEPSRNDETLAKLPHNVETLSKLDMTDEIWSQNEAQDQSTRILAEHFSGVLTLGRLELFTVALEALTNKKFSEFRKADPAYALMGFLNHRVQLEGDEQLFEALARLSLENDSDHLVERMVCMFPDSDRDEKDIFRSMTGPDKYGARLWDIQPICQVAGLGQDSEIILDRCRAISIRWKAFPRIKYKRGFGFRRLVAELALRSGVYTSSIGAAMIINYSISWYTSANSSGQSKGQTNDPNGVAQDYNLDEAKDILFIAIGALLFLFSILLALTAPAAVRRLFGGKITESAPWLVGFEGVMPIQELEHTIFGNVRGRLTYESSSTPFSEREPYERLGREPAWVAQSGSTQPIKPPPLPRGHRFFTLVDTGELSVSIFSAARPPSVALVCGREGGMLRTLLCHYERSNNCLYRESVLRMHSMTLNKAEELSWIKLSLGKL